MKKTLIRFAISLFLVPLAACSTVGRKCDFDAMKQNIKLNETLKQDVLGMCGEPMSKDSNMKDGTETWHYLYISKNITGLGVLAHATGVGREIESKRTIMDITFKAGIVVDVATEDSSMKKMHY